MHEMAHISGTCETDRVSRRVFRLCFKPGFSPPAQVKAMNEAVEEDEDADIEDVDAESRRFLREVGAAASNATTEPWKVGQAGQQVTPATTCRGCSAALPMLSSHGGSCM